MKFEIATLTSNIYGMYAIVGLSLLGSYSVAKWTVNLLLSVKRHYLRSAYPFYLRYARLDSWVVVTGGSDGIGYEICDQLAKQGFNICIIARNQQKMEEKCAELRK